MGTALIDVTQEIALEPSAFIGIPIALIGACFLSIGAQLQHHGVAKVEANTRHADTGLSLTQLGLLLARPSWVIGTVMLGLAIVFQLVSLFLAPIIVVQPLGAIALVVTAILNARVSHVKLNRTSIIAICLCVGGVGAFAILAAFTARDVPVSTRALVEILVILVVVLVAFGVLFYFLRARFKAVIYVVGAGVLYGFVATLAKVVLDRISRAEWDWLLVLCILALLAAAALGAYFVQNAYASGPPDLVIAGLTVIDPLVAVTIGIVILDEAAQAPWWAIVGYVVTGVIAVYGVFLLARHHPQNLDLVEPAAPSPVAVSDTSSDSGLD